MSGGWGPSLHRGHPCGAHSDLFCALPPCGSVLPICNDILVQVRLWKKWEEEGSLGSVLPATWQYLLPSTMSHCLHKTSYRLLGPIQKSNYLAVRRLFLETLKDTTDQKQVDFGFDFYEFCRDALGDFMARLVSLKWALWLMTAALLALLALLALPSPLWQMYAILGFGLISIITLYAMSVNLHWVLDHPCTSRVHIRFQEKVQKEDVEGDQDQQPQGRHQHCMSRHGSGMGD